eukprot:scaffold736_cov295-Prasinococcus_capsulatus_cf.AAC.3
MQATEYRSEQPTNPPPLPPTQLPLPSGCWPERHIYLFLKGSRSLCSLLLQLLGHLSCADSKTLECATAERVGIRSELNKFRS